MSIYSAFNRDMLRVTFEEVRATVPQAKARDIGVCKTGNQWTGELNRACYGGHFHWHGAAEDAWHAKQQTWEAWLERGPKQ